MNPPTLLGHTPITCNNNPSQILMGIWYIYYFMLLGLGKEKKQTVNPVTYQ